MTTSRHDPEQLSETLTFFWHPVATVTEVGRRSPLPVTLLGRDLAIARLDDGSVIALDDRCAHRSARLSVGAVDGCELRCAYHGWTWNSEGVCTSIPSLPDGPIPATARVAAHEVVERDGLIWVRLAAADGERRAAVPLPHCSATGDPSLHTLVGEPYTWPVAALRRVENFVDLAHFAFVHDGTLGSRDDPVPPLPAVERVGHELRFTYDPPDFDPDSSAMYGRSDYRMPMPCTVDIVFTLADGSRRVLWMTASPIDDETCRCFWFMSRDDDLGDGSPESLAERDAEHRTFQARVLAEDEPVVCSQTPAAFPLDPSAEVSVSTDLVSNLYRRWVRELVAAQRDQGSIGIARQLDLPVGTGDEDAVIVSRHETVSPSGGGVRSSR